MTANAKRFENTKSFGNGVIISISNRNLSIIDNVYFVSYCRCI